VKIVSGRGEEELLPFADVSKRRVGTLILEQVARTTLFKVHRRASGVSAWVSADSEVEFYVLTSLLADCELIFDERDIFIHRESLFAELRESPLTRCLRGDYALVESEIFDGAAFIVLPGTLPGSWKRADAVRSYRDEVLSECPGRVLLNGRYEVFKMLEGHLRDAEDHEGALEQVRTLLETFADGIAEQQSVTVARQHWIKLRNRIGQMIGKDLSEYGFDQLRGAAIGRR
jgi:hypothetical protein